jgi:putative lipoprotein
VRRFVTVTGLFVALAIGAVAPAARADDDEWLGPDKVLHFTVATVISAGSYSATAPLFDARYPPILIAAGTTLALGAAKEGYDSVSGGDPSWKDFTWDAIGMLAGLALAYGFDLAVRGVDHDHPLFGYPSTSSHATAPTRFLGVVRF